MCGICGIVDPRADHSIRSILQDMTDSLAHRGPDGEGVFCAGVAGLGHRRLAILDISEAGAQPMQSGNKRYTVSYNGEVYNYQELKHELEELGYSFRSTSDTEVILNGYAHWGPGIMDRLNGMLAFAIWDDYSKELFLARDRYGVKPLYYTVLGTTLVFASEQKALLHHPSIRRELDLEALLEYFTFQNLFTQKTLFKNIHIFPQGHYAFFRPGKNSLSLTQYWDFNFCEPAEPNSDEEYHEELDHLLQQAVKRQMQSDVEVGAYLSGGIDSGSVTAIAARQRPYIKTFTCGFDLNSVSGLELVYDERAKAEYMSYLFKTEHYEMVLKAGDMERCLPRLIWHLEEPRVGQSYPNYYVAQLASKFVKVILGGTGGDELFGGYPWRYYRAVVCDNFDDYVDKYYHFWQRLIPNKRMRKVFSPIWKDVQHVWTRNIFRDVFGDRADGPCSPHEFVNNSLYFEAKTFLHGLLTVEDKLSMAHGLEARVPFLDNDLVEFAMRLPVHLKLGNLDTVVRLNENDAMAKAERYYKKSRDGKLLLRRVMSRHVPPEIADDVKQGFSAPDASWFKGESIKYVSNTLIKGKARIYDYLDRDSVRLLVLEHLEGKNNRRLLIWALLSFEHWLSTFLDNDND